MARKRCRSGQARPVFARLAELHALQRCPVVESSVRLHNLLLSHGLQRRVRIIHVPRHHRGAPTGFWGDGFGVYAPPTCGPRPTTGVGVAAAPFGRPGHGEASAMGALRLLNCDCGAENGPWRGGKRVHLRARRPEMPSKWEFFAVKAGFSPVFQGFRGFSGCILR